MELEGQLAPPMVNGELTFDAPWEGRVFGMARALCEAGLFEWDEFRESLIDEIGNWEQAHQGHEAYDYYERFSCALTNLLAQKGVVAPAELDERTKRFQAREHGHDH
ncbi:MAG: nitrile hydratase accessory protein [Pseudomonadota bacterium]